MLVELQGNVHCLESAVWGAKLIAAWAKILGRGV